MSQVTTEAAGIFHRRLPVYVVLDCSESMAGPAFDGLKLGLKVLLDEMLSDPMALETVSLSILTFHGKARVVLPLTSLPEVTIPRLILGSGTSFGAILELLAHRMNQEITIQTATRKGDWKPLVFILTDGEPTDSWQNQAAEFLKNISGRKANVIGVACGPAASLWALRQTTQVVVHLRDASKTQGFKEFFKWVSQSVKTTSARFLSGGTQGVALPDLPPSLELAPEGLQLPGGDSIHLLTRCEKTGRLFIMKYVKVPSNVTEEIKRRHGFAPPGGTLYAGDASHPLDDFDLEGSASAFRLNIPMGALVANPGCPHCGVKPWATCGFCNALFCCGDGGEHTCPWCHKTETYSAAEGEHEIDFGLG